MKRNRIVSLTLCAALMAGILAGCGGDDKKPSAETKAPENPPAQQTTTGTQSGDHNYNVDNMETLNLKICTSMKSAAKDTPGYCQATTFFADEITKRSGGKVTVTIYPDGQLGSSGDEMVSGATTGAFEFCTMGNGAFGEFTDAWMDFNLPFLFNSADEVDAYVDGPRGDAIRQQVIDDVGLRVLCYYDIGFRQTTSNKPIHSAADFKGLKIRTQSDIYQMAAFEAMGASTLSLSLSELFSALQQGVCDAQENPTINIIQQKFYEVQKYVTLTAHNFGLTTMCVSEDAFQSWSPDVQNLVLEVAAESTELCRQGLRSTTQEDIDFLKTVCEVYEPNEEEMQTFRDATKPVYDQVKEAVGEERYNEIMDAVAQVRE